MAIISNASPVGSAGSRITASPYPQPSGYFGPTSPPNDPTWGYWNYGVKSETGLFSAPPIALVVPTNTYLYQTDSGAADGSAVPNGANGVIAEAGTVVYSAAAAQHGSLGIQLSGAAYALGYSINPSFQASFYGQIITDGASNTAICTIRTGSSPTLAKVRANHASGKFDISDTANAVQAVASNSYLNRPYRIDVRCDTSGTTSITVTVRLFLDTNIEGTVPDETMLATLAVASAPDRFYFGAGTNGFVQYADTLRLYSDMSGWPSPFGADVLTVSKQGWGILL